MKLGVLPLTVLIVWCVNEQAMGGQPPVQPSVQPPVQPSVQPVPVQPTPFYQTVPPDGVPEELAPALADAPARRRPLHECLNRCGLACYANHNQFGCGSLHSELTFIFGSCRTFFGETCVPLPPHQHGKGLFGKKSCCQQP